MAFDVTLLPAYVDQNRFPLLRKAIFGSKTISMLTPQFGIKSSATLNIVDDSITFQDGSSCAYNPSGSTTFSQRELVTGRIKVQKEWCVKDLEPKYLQTQLMAGANTNALPFEQDLINAQLVRIESFNEIAAWQGDTASTNPNLNRYNGLIKNISGSTGYITGNSATYGQVFTAVTESNVRDVLNQIYKAIPDEILNNPDTIVFVSTDIYKSWVTALSNANMYHYVSDGTQSNMEFTIPGTDVRVVAVKGLTGTRVIVAASLSNLFYGTDLMSDSEEFEIYYDPKLKTFSFTAEWRAGTQIAFPDQVVYFKY